MNLSNLSKNIKVNFNFSRSLIMVGVLLLVYFISAEAKSGIGDLNFAVIYASFCLVAYNVLSSTIREVNEGTWCYVVTSKLTPSDVLVGQIFGSAPIALIVGLAAFFGHLVFFNAGVALTTLAVGIFVVALYGCVASWKSVNWEQSVASGKSFTRIENQLSALSLVGLAFVGFMLYALMKRPTQAIPWYGQIFNMKPFLVSTFVFFSLLTLGGQIRNIQQAMKMRLSSLYWAVSGWIIVAYFLGFSFINEDWLVALFSDVANVPDVLVKTQMQKVSVYFTYMRLHFIYSCWLLFLFISLITNPLSATQVRMLVSRLKNHEWLEFLKIAPASFVNLATVLFAFIALFFGYLTLPRIDFLGDFLETLFITTCTFTLVLLRDALVLWIFARLYKKHYLLVFVLYLASMWFLLPVFSVLILGKDTSALKIFWPLASDWQGSDMTGLIIVAVQVVLVGIGFYAIQKRVSPKINIRSS